MKIITNHTFKFNLKEHGKTFTEPSMTRQNEGITIQEIVDRSIQQGNWPYKEIGDRAYMDIEDINEIGKFQRDLRSLDLTDLQELRDKTDELRKKVKDGIEKANRLKAKEAEDLRVKQKAIELYETNQKTQQKDEKSKSTTPS